MVLGFIGALGLWFLRSQLGNKKLDALKDEVSVLHLLGINRERTYSSLANAPWRSRLSIGFVVHVFYFVRTHAENLVVAISTAAGVFLVSESQIHHIRCRCPATVGAND